MNNLFPPQVGDQYVHCEIYSEARYYVNIDLENNYIATIYHTWSWWVYDIHERDTHTYTQRHIVQF